MASDFGKEVRELLAQADDADKDNREEALIDLDFEAGIQWDAQDRLARETHNPPLPCITVNVVQQYTAMVIGDWLQNDTSIKVLPREDGDIAIADIRSELIRSIELQSKASRIYASSLGQMVACGISNFKVEIDYAYDDAFDKDIFLRDIPDPLAVRWDPLAFDPTGRDAKWCFDGFEMVTKDYEKAYPGAAAPTVLERELRGTSWYQNNTVFVPNYWKMIEKLRTFGLTADGKTVDLTELSKNKWPKLAVDPQTGQKIVREKAKCKYAVRVTTNGLEELSDPYELRLSRLPIIRVMGRETITAESRVRSGLIRWMRDDQRMKNYLRSIRAELLMRAARVNFIASTKAVEGREDDWDNTAVYNEGATPPIEVTARNLASLINEEQFYSQDMMDVTGIHEASRGMPSNETSGRAILARQQEGDTATIIYHTNMTNAQQEAGEVINELIDTVYDTARTIRTVGPDLGVKMVRINDDGLLPNGQPDPQKYQGGPASKKYQQAVKTYQGVNAAVADLTLGKYDVTISTGPSYATRRQESASQLTELVSRAPRIAEVAGDLIVGELDLINGDKIAERVKRALPPQILGDDADDGKSPEEIAQQQQSAAQAQQVQQMGMELEMRGKKAEIDLKEAQAAKAQAEAMAAGQGQVPQADPMMAAQELRLKSAQADEAEATAGLAQVQAMAALRDLSAGGDPEALQRLQIEAINAITKRIIALNPHITAATQPPPEEDLAA